MANVYIRKVNYYETDKMQCTHHSNYVRYMEEARVDYMDKLGYSYERLEAEKIVSPVIAVNLQFKKTTTFGDVIEIAVKPKSFTAVKVEFEYEMKCRGEIVCLANSVHCFLNEKGHPISLKRVKPELFELFTKDMESA